MKAADDPSLQLSRYGEYLYQNLVILAPGVEEFGGSLSVEVSAVFMCRFGGIVIHLALWRFFLKFLLKCHECGVLRSS